jgi:hypothetical protein
MWWFSGAAQDPANDDGWMVAGGYSLHVYDDGWEQPYSRRFEEINPVTKERTLIYELEGTTSDYVTYWLIPNGAPSSRIPSGWFCVGCYREFSRGGFAYFF